ncbi:uncharacterized protein JCM6883_002687 [Sporobolomyces salmoneus]|uniref:uncharacterized protein n=1 Tax=Sporobolomyces salmoneus TaxID=183962 RepID=UPI0031738C10
MTSLSNSTSRQTDPQSPRTPHRYQSLEELFETQGSTRRESGAGSIDRAAEEGDNDDDQVERPTDDQGGTKHSRLSTLNMINLTLGLGGAQLAWTVEMAYGTPYLLELGISKQGTSLVWMAGPISGMLIQPLVGALSDASHSRYRRRFFIALSALLIIASTLVVAFAKEIASVFCSLGGIGDWDPERAGWEQTVAIWIGVVGFYVLDFSLNGLQAAMRALVLDIVPSHQQNQGNAWLGRQTHIANILGYLCGFFDLGSVRALKWIGGGQFRRLGVISCLVMAISVGITFFTQEEEKRAPSEVETGNALKRVFVDIKDNIRDLPIEVRRVCYVQFFSWTSWFPFLFYGTTYVAESLYASIPKGEPLPSADDATRAGSLALLIYAIVSIAVGTFLPYLTTLGDTSWARRLSFSTPFGRTTRWILSLITPRNCWTFGLWSYVLGTIGTFFVTGPKGAMTFVAFQGISWAVTCWVPFALVMEYIREDEIPSSAPPHSGLTTPSQSPPPSSPFPYSRPAPFRTSNRQQSFINPYSPVSPASPRFPTFSRQNQTERSPLLPSSSLHERQLSSRSEETSRLESHSKTANPDEHSTPKGGTVLGIHNLSIVVPQFLVAIVSAIILKITSSSSSSSSANVFAFVRFFLATGGNSSGGPGEGGGGDEALRGSNDVVWVLRFGGLAAIGGAILSRWIVPPVTEREYVARVLYGEGYENGERDGVYERGREEGLLGEEEEYD